MPGRDEQTVPSFTFDEPQAAVDGDPLADVRNLLNVKLVIQGGVVFKPEQLLPMLPSTEPPAAVDYGRCLQGVCSRAYT